MSSISEEIKALPQLPSIVATSVLYAQAWKPSAEENAAMQAHADFARDALGLIGQRQVTLSITSPHGEALGYMTFLR